MKLVIFICCLMFFGTLAEKSEDLTFIFRSREDCLNTADSRCLNCSAAVDCATGTPQYNYCSPEGTSVCGEQLNQNGDVTAVYCSTSLNDRNDVCVCREGSNYLSDGDYDDPYSIGGEYINCKLGVPTHLSCPDAQAYDEDSGCFSLPECTEPGQFEVIEKCGSYLDCILTSPGVMEGTLKECDPDTPIFNMASKECVDPEDEALICEGATSTDINPYACNIYHLCNGAESSDVRTCDPGKIWDSVGIQCIAGSCQGDGLCIQKYFQKKTFQCASADTIYETSSICSEYYFRCNETSTGSLEPNLQVCDEGLVYYADIKACGSADNC